MWIIIKVFIEFVTVLLLFYVLGFLTLMDRFLAPRPGVEPTTLSIGRSQNPWITREVPIPQFLFQVSPPPKFFFFNCMMFSMHTFIIFLP